MGEHKDLIWYNPKYEIPKDGALVIVRTKIFREFDVCSYRAKDEGKDRNWWGQGDFYKTDEITHWAYIPRPTLVEED